MLSQFVAVVVVRLSLFYGCILCLSSDPSSCLCAVCVLCHWSRLFEIKQVSKYIISLVPKSDENLSRERCLVDIAR